ncbi:MAG TPA: 7-carboxy-7-deazaguanine synthase QueE [Ktedonobacteraceae bacterium]
MEIQTRTRPILISECFRTIQGEGMLLGQPTVFVRTGGCDYRCGRCDTLYAVMPAYRADWHPLSASEVFAEVRRLSGAQPILITLSGGNPAMQPLEEFIDLGLSHGYTFALETQGSIAQPWFARLAYLTLSPKAPGMENPWPTRWERFDLCLAAAQAQGPGTGPQICLKLVIFDEEDYLYARAVSERYPALPVYLQAGNHTPPHLANEVDLPGILSRLNWLIERVLNDGWYTARVLPQMHVLLWGNKRGV